MQKKSRSQWVFYSFIFFLRLGCCGSALSCILTYLLYVYIYSIKEATPHPPGLGSSIWSSFWNTFWGILDSKLGFRVQVGGLGGPFGIHFGSCRGWGGQEATGKGSGRDLVGSGVAGEPEIGPTWTQLEPSWSQLGPNTGPTWANLGLCWIQIGSSRHPAAIFRLSWGLLGLTRPEMAKMIQNSSNFVSTIGFKQQKSRKVKVVWPF